MNVVTEKRWLRRVFLFSGAMLTALSVCFPATLGWLCWISMIPSALVILPFLTDEKVRLRRLYGIGLLYFWCYYAVVFHWFISLWPMEFTGLPPIGAASVIVAGVFGLSLLQAFFSAFFFLFAGISCRSKLVKRIPVLTPFLICAFLTIAEWFQTVGWWGVPWGRISISQTAFPVLIQSASLLGSYLITFLILSVNFLLAFAFFMFRKNSFFMARIGCMIAAGLFVCNAGIGIFLYLLPTEQGRTIKVAAIQGNISSVEKWDENGATHSMEVYGRLTAEAAEAGAEVVVWPETALPYILSLPKNRDILNFVCECAKDNGVVLLVGAFDQTEDKQPLNSIFTVYPDGSIDDCIYDKRRPVPFGEYVPMREFISFIYPSLSDISMLSEDLCPGEEPNVVNTGIVSIGSIICFDSIYETLSLESVRAGAEILALSTNDSWFGNSVALRMHHAQAQLRAIETGRYVVRAANTGISSVITSKGEIVDFIGALQEGYTMGDAIPMNHRTLYVSIGNLFVWFLMFFAGGGIVLRIWDWLVLHQEQKKHRKSDSV